MTADIPDKEAGLSSPASLSRLLRRALELLAAQMEEGSFLREVCHLAVEAVGGAAAVILLPQEERLKPVAWAGPLPPVFLAASFSLLSAPEQHPFSQAYQTGVAVRCDGVEEDFGPLPWAAALREAELSACLAVPLRAAGRTLGVLAVFAPETRRLKAQEDLAELLAGVAAAGLGVRQQGEECRRLRKEAQGRGAIAAAEELSWEEDTGIGRFQARLPGFSLIAANDALARMLGWPEGDCLLKEFVPQERVAKPAAWERLLAQAAQGRVAGVEVPFLRRDGTVATLRLWGGWDEAREGFTGVAVDVSRLRELEEELAKLRQTHRLLKEQYLGASLLSQAEQEDLARERQVAQAALEACEAGVAAFTREGRLTHWNRAMEALTGLKREEVHGREVNRVLPGLTAGAQIREIREERRLLNPKQPVQLGPGGTVACYDALLAPLWDPRGEADGGIMVIRRHPEEAVSLEAASETEVSGGAGPSPVLTGAEKDAARRQRERLEALGSLAGSLARDFDQILAVMLGYAEMAQAALPEEDPARAKLAQILKAGRRGRDLVQQILAFSRPGERQWKAWGTQPEEAGEEPEAPGPPRQARGRILLAAADESQGTLWREILHSLGFEVHLALNGQEALELVRARPEGFDLMIADQNLAPVGGLELARQVRTLYPGLPVILSVDPLDLLTLEKAKNAGVQDFALKPWSLSELIAALDRILPPSGPKGLAS